MLSDKEHLRDIERKKRNSLPKAWYSDKQKLEAVQIWLLCGSMPQTAAALNIPVGTIEKWKYTDWWKELAEQIKVEGRVKLSGRLQKIVGRSLDQLEDRIENGDFILDGRSGELVRKPLLARDLTRISAEFMDSSRKLEMVTKEEATQQAVEDRLKLLADSFASFAKKVRKVEVEDAFPIESTASLDVREQAEDGEEVVSGDPEREEVAYKEEEVNGHEYLEYPREYRADGGSE